MKEDGRKSEKVLEIVEEREEKKDVEMVVKEKKG